MIFWGYVAVFVACFAVGYFFTRAVAPPSEVGFFVGRKESERRQALWSLRLEYAGKVDQSLLASVEHSPHSPDEVRQILDGHIESTARFDEMMADLRRERG